MATTFAELEAEIKRENVREEITAAREQGKWHGRPPFGFDVGSEGYLTLNDNYEKAVVVLDKEASKRQLARLLRIARSTVRTIAENSKRYTAQ
ncbi:serine integrase family protein [Halocatena pleomorpha]|uniref:hypothetical protein n=1 Tax=Halocatena pleomorpha TaxID=1785090 RepID=UPI001F45AFCA|nr:hypothetical protein [Halocatena pleomorpha]